MARARMKAFAKKIVYEILPFAIWTANDVFCLPLGKGKNSYKPENEDEFENFYELVNILENGSKGATQKIKIEIITKCTRNEPFLKS